jgi:hypothetical protein
MPASIILSVAAVQMAKAMKKVRVTLYMDKDVVEYFKGRATLPAAAAYQTQINAELRAVMERGGGNYAALLKDKKFISAVAEQVRKMLGRGKR